MKCTISVLYVGGAWNCARYSIVLGGTYFIRVEDVMG